MRMKTDPFQELVDNLLNVIQKAEERGVVSDDVWEAAQLVYFARKKIYV